MKEDIRWIQRFENYQLALKQLKGAVELGKQRKLSELEMQGTIQAFEYTHELAWNTLKDFLESKSSDKIYGSKDATRGAFKLDLIKDGEVWMDMIKSRNLSNHTYLEKKRDEVFEKIVKVYFNELLIFKTTLLKLKEQILQKKIT